VRRARLGRRRSKRERIADLLEGMLGKKPYDDYLIVDKKIIREIIGWLRDNKK